MTSTDDPPPVGPADPGPSIGVTRDYPRARAGIDPDPTKGWLRRVAPIVLSPVLFVYCELLPKQLFYLAPHRLVRQGGPFFLFCASKSSYPQDLICVGAR